MQWEGVTGLYKGVAAPLAGQMFFRATLFSALGSSKRWLSTDAEGNRRDLTMLDCYKAGAMAGGAAAFFEGPIDFYKSQVRSSDVPSCPQQCPQLPTRGHRCLCEIAMDHVRSTTAHTFTACQLPKPPESASYGHTCSAPHA